MTRPQLDWEQGLVVLAVEGIDGKPEHRMVSHHCDELGGSLRAQMFQHCLKSSLADSAVAYQFLTVVHDFSFSGVL
jgi:hypothetical protein